LSILKASAHQELSSNFGGHLLLIILIFNIQPFSLNFKFDGIFDVAPNAELIHSLDIIQSTSLDKRLF